MIATQVITVAVKNMANMKIFVKASFMVVVLLQSENAFLYHHINSLSPKAGFSFDHLDPN